MTTLIKDGLCLLPEGDGYKIEKQDILIDGDTIAAIMPETNPALLYAVDDVCDAFGKLVMPGLINSHAHAYMSLFRNAADDMAFFDWLDSVQKVEDNLTTEDCYWGTCLSAVEMIRTGTTSFVDMTIKSAAPGETSGPAAAIGGAASDMGIRAFISRGLAGEADDPVSIQKFGEAVAEMETFKDNPLVEFLFGPHAPYSCAAGYLQKLKDHAVKMDKRLTIHLSESKAEMESMAKEHGVTPIKYVADLGLFEAPTIAAHCVNATDDDIRIMAENGVSIAINPKSNMKLGNGFAPAQKFVEAGINVCLGTDGAGSNNSQNMFQEMNTAALIYKGANESPEFISATQVLKMATENGAKALGMEGRLGVLKEGALADIILLDMYAPQFFPGNNIISGLVYSLTGTEVDTVFIGGRMVMEEKKIVTMNPGKIYTKCNEICKRVGLIK